MSPGPILQFTQNGIKTMNLDSIRNLKGIRLGAAIILILINGFYMTFKEIRDAIPASIIIDIDTFLAGLVGIKSFLPSPSGNVTIYTGTNCPKIPDTKL